MIGTIKYRKEAEINLIFVHTEKSIPATALVAAVDTLINASIDTRVMTLGRSRAG